MDRIAINVILSLALVGVTSGCGGATKKVRGVEASALPYRVVAQGGSQLAESDFLAQLRAADAVCLGETHSNPHDHWAQLHILTALTEKRTSPMAVGLEMVQQPFQGVLNDWQQKKISNSELVSRTGWQKRWGFDFDLYRPIIERARARGLEILALRISDEDKEAFKKTAPEARASGRFPELDLNNAAHRAWFEAQMGSADHGHEDEKDSAEKQAKMDRFYAVQVLWDESMAESAANWLKGGAGRKLIIIAGKGHCHESAIVSRLRRRGAFNVRSVFPVIDDGTGGVAGLIAEKIHDYLFVMSPPSGGKSSAAGKADPGAGESLADDTMRK